VEESHKGIKIMKKDPTVYTQYCVDGTVRMSLHPFDAPFGYTEAPEDFKFKHRVIVREGNLEKEEGDSAQPFRVSCYSTDGNRYFPEENEIGFEELCDWEKTEADSNEELEANKYAEFAMLNWLLEGEE